MPLFQTEGNGVHIETDNAALCVHMEDDFPFQDDYFPLIGTDSDGDHMDTENPAGCVHLKGEGVPSPKDDSHVHLFHENFHVWCSSTESTSHEMSGFHTLASRVFSSVDPFASRVLQMDLCYCT